MKLLHSNLIWGEGVRWHGRRIWLSDTQDSRLWSGADDDWSDASMQPVSNGLWFLPDGRLTGALTGEGRIGLWNGANWSNHADLSALGPGPLGDMTGDAAGNLYVDDVGFNAAAGEPPKAGRILFVSVDGTARVAIEDVHFPNGIALINGGRTLIVAETFNQRLLAFDVDGQGRLSGRRVFANLVTEVNSNARPDGICSTANDDGVWVATLDGHVIARVRDGHVDAVHACGDYFPIACCVDNDGNVIATLADTGGRNLMEALRDKSVRTSVVQFPQCTA